MQIGSTTSAQQMHQTQLLQQVSAGEITSEDSDAMLAALEAISEDMAPSGTTSETPPSEEEMQAKLESLLSEQVEAGTLTQEQADELADMFESGDMGPPPPPSASASSDSDDSEDLVAKLLEELSSAASSSYSEDGSTTSSTSSTSSILVDFLA